MTKEKKETRPEMDKRLINEKILRRQMSEKELSQYLKTLPDVSDNAEEIVFVLEERK
jgi:hypothetical protein